MTDDTGMPGGGGTTNLTTENTTEIGGMIKLGIDAHAKWYYVARQLDGAPPQPVQKMTLDGLLHCVAKQWRLVRGNLLLTKGPKPIRRQAERAGNRGRGRDSWHEWLGLGKQLDCSLSKRSKQSVDSGLPAGGENEGAMGIA